ncbi:hypothetical protein PsAD37_04490 [Pseudovibrio sp. Ad37]|nr:hypothetical protein PsAD37_04490 [Pseudovibrio sp. Ad37]
MISWALYFGPAFCQTHNGGHRFAFRFLEMNLRDKPIDLYEVHVLYGAAGTIHPDQQLGVGFTY